MSPTPTKTRIVTGRVMHCRFDPCEHRFEYPVNYYILNLSELQSSSLDSWIFGYNKKRIISIHDRDYLTSEPADIRRKLFNLLTSFNHEEGLESLVPGKFSEIILVTNCRYFGHVFNPVSFFYCYGEDDRLEAIAVEINNTFQERHVYLLTNPSESHGKYSFKTQKEFHVSPFFSRQGEYKFRFSDIREKLDIAIDLVQNNTTVFTSRLWGKRYQALTSANLVFLLARFPFNAALTIPRIYWQAMRLYFQRKLAVFQKPDIMSDKTIYAYPYSWLDRICMHFILKSLGKLSNCKFTVIFPDGSIRHFGEISSNSKQKDSHSKAELCRAIIKLNNFRIFRKVFFKGGIGFGESYVANDWDSPDLPGLIKVILNNWGSFSDSKLQIFKPYRIFQFFRHLSRRNSRSRSKKNIEAHYDLGNDLFSLFLDPTMMYSSGIFRSSRDSLEDSQINKIGSILQKARIKETDNVLEIGSGWGSFAIEAAKQTGCKVTSITLSSEQCEHASAKARELKVDSNVSFKLQDYRHVTGSYDKIVSIEMIEAVGSEYLVDYFKIIDRSLKSDGIAVIQAIIFPHTHYKSYCKRADWIQEYIFPGSHLPTLARISEIISTHTELQIDNIENLSVDYARTLSEWRKRFLSHPEKLKEKGYDEKFQRMWEYYLASCEAEFSTRWLQVMQIVLIKPNNLKLANAEAKEKGYLFRQPEQQAAPEKYSVQS